MWRNKLGVLQDLCFPIAVTAMILAAYLANVPSNGDLEEYTETAMTNWKQAGKVKNGPPAVSDKLFFMAGNFSTPEVESILNELYEGDTQRSASQSRQFDSYSEMISELYDPATLKTNADYVLQIYRNGKSINYTLQASIGSLPAPARDPDSKSFVESNTWGKNQKGVFDFQYRLSRGLNGTVGINENTLNGTIQRFPSNNSQIRPTNELRHTEARKDSSWTALGAVWWASSFVVIQISVVRSLVREREIGIRYSLQSLGLNPVSFRLANTLSTLLVYGLSVLPSIALYTSIGVFYSSNMALLWGAHLFFILILTSFSSMLSMPLQKVPTGASVIAFIIYGLGVGLGAFAHTLSKSNQLLCCFVPSSYIVIFTNAVYELENKHGGLQWDTIGTELEHNPSVADLYGMQVASFFVFELINVVADNWEYIKDKVSKMRNGNTISFNATGQRTVANEAALLSAKNISMTYSDGFTAVNGIDIDVYEGEVLGLLGHNGAGKSTTINMLQGRLTATNGEIYFKNNNIASSLSEMRDSLGVCPQHDILFDSLTAREHLLLVGALKGIPLMKLSAAVDTALEEVGIKSPDTPNLQHTMATKLSGGQKRKISVAMAFMGQNTKLVFLDEPTAGMDPASRRLIWEVIEKKKHANNVGIVLTTHFMDEADLLSDKIAIMHAGEICDEGSSLELKGRHSSGYTLTVSTSANAEGLLSIVRKYVPSLTQLSHCGDEIVFGIDRESLCHLPNLLQFLDDPSKTKQLDIRYYGLSMGTLQDVFLALERSASTDTNKEHKAIEFDALEIPTKSGSYVFAMFYKRFCCTRRDRQILLFQILFPCIFTVIGLLARHFIKQSTSSSADFHPVLPYSGVRTAVYTPTLSEQQFLQRDWIGGDVDWGLFSGNSSLPYNTTDLVLNATSVITNNWISNFNVMYAGDLNYATLGFWQNTVGSLYPTQNAVTEFTIGNLPPAPWSVTMAGDMILIISVAVGLSFMMSAAALYVVRERHLGCVNLQLASGTPIFIYWMTTLIWDCIISFVCTGLVTLLLLSLLDDNEKLQSWYVSAILYSIASSLLSYVCSFLFSDATKAQIVISGYLIGLCSSFVIADLAVTASTGSGSSAAEIIPIVFASINPTYAIAKILMIEVNFLGQYEFLKTKSNGDYFSYHILGKYHKIFGYQIAGLIGLLIFIELPIKRWYLFAKLKFSNNSRGSSSELTTILSGKQQPVISKITSPQVRISGLTKKFKKGKATVTVVDNISLDIAKGCFGLLGINGAGKSTMIKMLTGEYLPTYGDAEIVSKDGTLKSILFDSSKVRQNIGLCPQFDTFLSEMTGFEIIKFHCMLKGVPPTNENIWSFLSIVGIQQYGKKPAGTYSGGNKRKLSLAIALIGRPPVVFLDEPSTGVDPQSKRTLWDVIQNVSSSRTVILTSHSMEEIDALSNMVGIMKDGNLLKLGTPQQLRSELSSGYSLQFTVDREESVGEVINKLQSEYFPSLVVNESHKNRVAAFVPGVSPSVILQTLRDIHIGIVEYAVTQTSLEQVFLDSVADHQKDIKEEV